MRVSLNKEMTVIADSCPAKGPQKTALGHVPKYTSLFITLMVENGADFIVYRSLCSKSPFSTILRQRHFEQFGFLLHNIKGYHILTCVCFFVC
mmetsp:Transcript_21617/g.28477  ORF Transcript_21617/g.28477 Transcript_21617/m.28477 type:complete len:93 (+) Transcript_21617:269-547(+)